MDCDAWKLLGGSSAGGSEAGAPDERGWTVKHGNGLEGFGGGSEAGAPDEQAWK